MTAVWCLLLTALISAELSVAAAAFRSTSTFTSASFATVAGPVSETLGSSSASGPGSGAAAEASAAVTSSDLPRQIPPPQSRAAAAAAAAARSSTPEYDEQVPSLRMVWVTRDPHADMVAAR